MAAKKAATALEFWIYGSVELSGAPAQQTLELVFCLGNTLAVQCHCDGTELQVRSFSF